MFFICQLLQIQPESVTTDFICPPQNDDDAVLKQCNVALVIEPHSLETYTGEKSRISVDVFLKRILQKLRNQNIQQVTANSSAISKNR